MGVSVNWLKDYVDFEWSAEELAHRLTMAGMEIDGIEKKGDDAILELDLTPNRGDCLGLINLSREVAAFQGTKIKLPAINLKENNENINDFIKIEINEPQLCKRYAARVIKGVKIAPSPEWMQTKLQNSGIRPVNNVVDITNFVLLESNQPLHAFDYDLLSQEKKIVVRRAKSDEKFTTLDGVTRKLDEEALVISDGPNKAVALAGIMGGANTEINDNTVNVLLEAANFYGINIRKTSRKLALRSDSSVRFEKGADINALTYALDRAAALLQELAGGEVVGGILDVYPEPVTEKVIVLRPERVNKLLGINLTSAEIKGYLNNLKLEIEEKEGNLHVVAPSYRPDLDIEVDLIEEVARLYGYDKIPTRFPVGVTTIGGVNDFQKFREKIKDIMSGFMFEVINYSFVSPRLYDQLTIPEDSKKRNFIKIANPLSEEQSVMRTLLLPGILDTISRNLTRKNSNLAFFEMGAIFNPVVQGQVEEKIRLGGAVAGKTVSNWLNNSIVMDFFYLKGILEKLFQQLGMQVEYVVANNESYHPGRTAALKIEGEEIGIIGEIHPQVRQNFAIKERVCAFEIDVEKLFTYYKARKMMENISRYPAVERDLAVLIREDLQVQDLIKAIKTTAGPLLQELVVFDVYAGEQVAANHKSIAMSLRFQSTERTLTEEEINTIIKNIVDTLAQEFTATLR